MSIKSFNVKFAPCSVSYIQNYDILMFYALYPTFIELNTRLKQDADNKGITAQW